MLKIQILIKNNENTIRQALESLLPLKSEIVVGNLGSKDKTIDICRDFEVKIIDFSHKNQDLSKIRNALMGKDWNFYVHPWEVLASGHDFIYNIQENSAYNLAIYQNKIINFEIRLWKNHEFKNPIYETICGNSDYILKEGIIYSKPNEYYFDQSEITQRIKDWNTSLLPESVYYEAFDLLKQRKYASFCNKAEYYLTIDNASKSAIMMRYYLAKIQFIGDQISKAIQNIIICISRRPLMAEFWCLVGDIHYRQKKYDKAESFYETALFLGQKRLNFDGWPIEIEQYDKHPNKMIENIKELAKHIRVHSPQQ
jgi:tetratricopeptide (TPR) repeat protein